jgi:hypothetical protein
MLLLNKVNKFNRRLRMRGNTGTRPVMTEADNRQLGELDDLIGIYMYVHLRCRWTPLTHAVKIFRRHFEIP